jgi:hypothetical protein
MTQSDRGASTGWIISCIGHLRSANAARAVVAGLNKSSPPLPKLRVRGTAATYLLDLRAALPRYLDGLTTSQLSQFRSVLEWEDSYVAKWKVKETVVVRGSDGVRFTCRVMSVSRSAVTIQFPSSEAGVTITGWFSRKVGPYQKYKGMFAGSVLETTTDDEGDGGSQKGGQGL